MTILLCDSYVACFCGLCGDYSYTFLHVCLDEDIEVIELDIGFSCEQDLRNWIDTNHPRFSGFTLHEDSDFY